MKKVLIADAPAETYVNALERLGVETRTTTSIVSPDEFDGLVLPGGGDIDPARFGEEMNGTREIDYALDDVQFALLDAFVKQKKPVIGICKGCQVLNVYFGGSLYQDLPDGIREHHSYHNGTGEYHKTFIDPGNFLYDAYGPEVTTNSYHHQANKALGKGIHVIQKSDDGVIEAIVHESLPVIGLQWHPEKNIFETVLPGVADGKPVFEYYISLL